MSKLTKIFLLLICIFFTSCEEQKKISQNEIEVGFITLNEQEIPIKEELSGRVKPKLVSEIRPQISGIIKKVLFKEGSFVKKGTILYQIDDASYKANYEQAQASVRSAKADLETLKLKNQRYVKLLEIEAISKQDADDAKASYLKAKASLDEKIALMKSSKISLDRTKIKATISGYIGISNVTQGALILENQSDSLTTIRDTSVVFVDLNQSLNKLLSLKKMLKEEHVKKGSTEVDLILSDNSIYPHKGTLQLQEINVNENTGAVTLRAQFPNKEGILLPGMFAKARIQTVVNSKAFLIPQQAVSRDSKANTIITVINNDNTIATKEIQTNGAIDNFWIVTSGINENDKIIIEGLNKINSKSVVKPLNVTSKYIKS